MWVFARRYSVGGRFRTQQQPNYALWSTLVFFFYLHDSGFRRASVWASSWKKMWILIAGFSDEMWMLQWPKEEIVAFFYKKKKKPNNFLSRPIKRLARHAGSSATMFLVDMIWTQTPAHWHLKIPIKWCGSIYFVSLVEKVQFHLSRKSYRKFHSNGKRSRSPR